MKFIKFPAAKTGAGYEHFERTVKRPVALRRLRSSMTTQEHAELEARAQGQPVSVWALALTQDARNLRQWDAIDPGDVAFFYTEKRFSHSGPVLYKWRSDSLQDVVGWTARPDGARYSLAVALGPLDECNFRVDEYTALLGYKRMPMHSEVHTEQDSDELFEAMKFGFRVDSPDDEEDDGLDWEGRKKYRVQQLRERSDGNRLQVLLRGHVCEVCGFDFAAQFGTGFSPSAHVHHKNPLALGERKAQSVDEFAVLCGACHTAAHMGKGRKLNPWTVDELRARIASSWRLS